MRTVELEARKVGTCVLALLVLVPALAMAEMPSMSLDQGFKATHTAKKPAPRILKSIPTPTVTLLNKAWGLNGGMGVEASSAWAKLAGGDCSKSKVTVAVIDTGIDMNHEALQNSLWNNEAIAGGAKSKVDEKFPGDVHGWDFVKKTGQLSDSHGHGTHIAGIIAGLGKDYRGVCPGVKIMSLRYYDPNGSGDDNLRHTIEAIHFAVDHHVNIINYSGGGAEFAKGEFDALKEAESQGILVVAAAGNEHNNADNIKYYPAAYDLRNIISVTAINEEGKVLPSSNFGIQKVHVAAPGQSILSTLPSGSYGMMTGTSQATAFVSGIAAMLMTDNPSLSMADVKNIIEASAVPQKMLVGKTKTGARADAVRALDLERAKRSLVGKKSVKVERTVATKVPTATSNVETSIGE